MNIFSRPGTGSSPEETGLEIVCSIISEDEDEKAQDELYEVLNAFL